MAKLNVLTKSHFHPLILLLAFPFWTNAQALERQVVATTGTEVATGSLGISYTVGEAVVQSLTNGNLILTQGYHQGTAADVATSLPNVRNLSELLTAYPNPTRDIVYFRVEGYDGALTAELINMEGKMMLPQSIAFRSEEEYSIDMSLMPSGQYILRVTNSTDKAQGFYKIVKLK